MRRRYFTVIEAIVCLCIAAILAAIILPVFAHARPCTEIAIRPVRLENVELGSAFAALRSKAHPERPI
jgi:hypothetical protein